MPTRANNWFENFSSAGPTSSKFVNWGASNCKYIDGNLVITTALSATYYGMDIQDRLDLTGSEVKCQVLDAGNQSLASLEVGPIQLQVDASNQLFFLISGGVLRAYKKVSGANTSLGTVSYNSTTQRYVRIRESGGTCYFEYSADGFIWTTLASTANPFAITDLLLSFYAGTYAIEGSTTSVTFDDYNYIAQNGLSNYGRHISVGGGMSRSESAT
jgi:hypothetical protein